MNRSLEPAPAWMARTWEGSGLAGMVVAATAAILFGFAVGPWFRTLSESLEVTGRALIAVDSTIEIVDESLVVLSETLVGVDGVLSATESALADVSAVVLATGGLLQDEIPSQVASIQTAMDGLIGTANVVDGVLSALSFVGVDYDPEVPLDEALIDVNDQLEELSASLEGYSANLFTLTVSLNRLGSELDGVGENLLGLEEQVEESRELIAEYRETAETAQTVIEDAAGRLDGQVWVVRVLGVVILSLLVPLFGLLWWMGRSMRGVAGD